MQLSLNNKYLHLASAFTSGFSLGYLICLYRRKSKPTGGDLLISIPNPVKKCTGDVCPIDMTAVFKQADEQSVQQVDKH
jgi:hypothetical protein